MILFLSNGRQIRGDLIDQAILRSDLSPIPVTLEADIRAGDDDFEARLQEGQLLKTVSGDEFYIIKSERTASRASLGDKELAGFRITALLNCCLSVAYVRSRAIIKENATLSAIYRAAGASIPSIQSDFPVPRFYCPIGQTPTFHIARVLQEEGGVVRWKNSKLQFIRLQGILDGKVVRTLPETAALDVNTGFLERHEVPWFFSLDETGGFVFGNRDKPRSVQFSPFKNVQRLRNLTRCLIHRKTAKILYDINICAGDVIAFTGGTKYAVITAAHVFKSGSTDGGATEAFTRLWLGEVEQ
nr:MAG TPA: hypothetical protein [Caudoviricetes sp.]